MMKTVASTMSLSILSLTFAFLLGCGKEGDDEFEAKRICYENRVRPLREKAIKGDLAARARMSAEALNRIAADCKMNEEQRKKAIATDVAIAQAPVPSPTSTTAPAPGSSVVALPEQVLDQPVQDMEMILKSIPDDGKCRLRYFDESAGSNAGYNVLSGKTFLQTAGITYFNSGIAAYSEAVFVRACVQAAPENCTLRFRKAKSGLYRGYFIAIEGNDLNADRTRSYKSAEDVVTAFNRLKAAGICELKSKASCQVMPVGAGNFAVVSQTNDWLHDAPYSTLAEANYSLSRFRSWGFCQ